jgi:hypothetical protein
MEFLRRLHSDLPQPARFLVFGALLGGAVGGVTGLVIGLHAYPPTAWFAFFELGAPGAIAGALLGTITGSIARLVAAVRRP